MALTLSSAARLANPNFGNIEQLGQDIGSLSARRRQRGMLTDLLGPLTDPMATSADYATAAEGLMGIDQGLGLQVAARGRTLAEQEEAKRLSEEQATTQRGLQGGLAAITQAAVRGIPLSDLTEATGSILRLGGTNQQIIDAYEAGKTDSRIMNVGGKLAIDEDIYAAERAKGESGDITKSFILPPGEDGQQKSIFENVPANQLVKIFGDSVGPALVLYGQGKEDEALKTLKPVDQQAEAPQQIKDQLDALDRDLGAIDQLIELDEEGRFSKTAFGIYSSDLNPFSTDEKSVKGLVTQIQAGLAFDELKKMRKESKTGGALGSVSNIEINLLQSAIAALDPSAPNFGDQLKVVRRHYQNFKDAILGKPPSAGSNYRLIDGTLFYTSPDEKDQDGNQIFYNLTNIANNVAAGRRVAVPTPFSYELEANFEQPGQK